MDAAIRLAKTRSAKINEARIGTCGPHLPPTGGLLRSSGFDEPKLGQCSHAVVETDLLGDLPVDHLQYRGAGEVHLAAGRGRQATDQEVVERRTLMGTATFPLTNDVVALGDQVCGAPEIEVGECCAKVFMNAFMSSRPRRGSCSEYFSSMSGAAISSIDREIDVLAPEVGKPAADNGLVIFFLAHGIGPR